MPPAPKDLPIRVLIVDDHPIVRAGLHTLAEIDPRLVIAGEAATAAEAALACVELHPDVLLLDLRLPDRSGLELCRELKARPNPPRILFLTSFADNSLILAAMEAGSDGYLLKESGPTQIAAAIHAVARGSAVFDPVATRAVLGGARVPGPNATSELGRLSAQERRVLAEVASGRTDKEVASTLGLQTKTVRNYLDRVFEKLGVNSRTQAALIYDRQQRPPPAP